MTINYFNIDQWIEGRGPSVARTGKSPPLEVHNYCIPDVGDRVDLCSLGEHGNIGVKVTEVMGKANLCRGVYLVVDNTRPIFDRKWLIGEEVPVEFSLDRIRCIHERNDC